eukprot:1967256-Rhodomonas_salina.1
MREERICEFVREGESIAPPFVRQESMAGLNAEPGAANSDASASGTSIPRLNDSRACTLCNILLTYLLRCAAPDAGSRPRCRGAS